MALPDHKMPIIAGINDLPSSEGDATHPNSSLFQKKYNDLIDELTEQAVCPNLTKQSSVVIFLDSIYVDATTGDDTTGNGSDTAPFATIQKAIDVICTNKVAGAEILLSGTFINPSLDFCKYYALHSGSSVISYNVIDFPFVTWFKNAGITITTLSTATIVWDSNQDDESTNIPSSLIYSPHNIVRFESINFSITGNEPAIFQHSHLLFEQCTFTLTTPEPIFYVNLLSFYFSKVVFEQCTFIQDASNVSYDRFSTVAGYGSDITLHNSTLTISDPSNTINWQYANTTNCNLFLPTLPPDISLSFVKRCNVWVNLDTRTIGDLQLSGGLNNIKEHGSFN